MQDAPSVSVATPVPKRKTEKEKSVCHRGRLGGRERSRGYLGREKWTLVKRVVLESVLETYT